MILKGESLSQTEHAAKGHNTERWQWQLDRLSDNAACLRQVESRMDTLLRQLLIAWEEHTLSEAAERLDELILAYPMLRVPQVAVHGQAAHELLAHLDLDHGPLPGFPEAMTRLCALVLTPNCLDELRSRLYTVAARVARDHPDLLPTVALATLSTHPPCPTQTLFTEMVLCASAIEWSLTNAPHSASGPLLDVSAWLIVEPSERLLADVGKERAHYYASIPGVLPLLDPNRILFDVQRSSGMPHTQAAVRTLDDLANPSYTQRLRTEIERVQGALRKAYPTAITADVELLTLRALEALDDLPVQVNPLLQAIWIQSWVRHLQSSNQGEEVHTVLSTQARREI